MKLKNEEIKSIYEDENNNVNNTNNKNLELKNTNFMNNVNQVTFNVPKSTINAKLNFNYFTGTINDIEKEDKKAFIPQINIYLSSTVIDKILTFPNLTWEEAWLPANKISYMEVLIIKIATIILYLCLSAFIHKYKNSGLGFFKFIQSVKK